MSFEYPAISFWAIAPEIVLTITALAVLLIDVVAKKVETINITLTALIGVLLALVVSTTMELSEETLYSGMIVRDQIALVLEKVFLVGTALIILISHRFAIWERVPYSEYMVLLLSASLGMLIISLSADLVILFIGIELVSLPLYVLAGINKSSLSSGEASLKYFLLGAFSTGFMVYGMAFIYGMCRSTNLTLIGSISVPIRPRVWFPRHC